MGVLENAYGTPEAVEQGEGAPEAEEPNVDPALIGEVSD